METKSNTSLCCNANANEILCAKKLLTKKTPPTSYKEKAMATTPRTQHRTKSIDGHQSSETTTYQRTIFVSVLVVVAHKRSKRVMKKIYIFLNNNVIKYF